MPVVFHRLFENNAESEFYRRSARIPDQPSQDHARAGKASAAESGGEVWMPHAPAVVSSLLAGSWRARLCRASRKFCSWSRLATDQVSAFAC
jgi:hypothetical protein